MGAAHPDSRIRDGYERPLGRLGLVDEVAALLGFLLSDEAAFISGGVYMCAEDSLPRVWCRGSGDAATLGAKLLAERPDCLRPALWVGQSSVFLNVVNAS